MTAAKQCSAIAELWVLLNPHCQVHGCEINPIGTVTIWILFTRSKSQQPLELCIGNPPRTVINGLRNALREQERAKRLTKVSGSTKITDDTGKVRNHNNE